MSYEIERGLACYHLDLSYEIERGRACYHLGLSGDDRFPLPHAIVYLWHSASNNVQPRDWHWSVIAVDWELQPPPNIWGKNVVLPIRIYEMAHYASGGGIKPGDVDITGIDYLQRWQETARHPQTKRLDPPEWTPTVDIWWMPDLKQLASGDVYDKNRVLEALTCLNPKRGYYDNQQQCVVETAAQLKAALYLFSRRKELPFQFYLSGK